MRYFLSSYYYLFFFYTISFSLYSQSDLSPRIMCDTLTFKHYSNLDSLFLNLKLNEANASYCALQSYLKKNPEDQLIIAQKLKEFDLYYFKQQDYNTAIPFEIFAASIWKKLGNKKEYVVSLIRLSEQSYLTGDYKVVANALNESYDICESNNFTKEKVNVLFWMASLNRKLESFQQTFLLLEEAEKIVNTNDDLRYLLPKLLSLRAHTLNNTGQKDKAIKTINLALTACDSTTYKSEYALILSNKSYYYININRSYAYELLYKALAMEQQVNDKEQLASNYGVLSYMYVLDQKYDLAEQAASKGLQYAQETGSKLRIIENYHNLYKTYKASKQYDKAVYYLDKFQEMSREIFGIQAINKVKSIEKEKIRKSSRLIIDRINKEKKAVSQEADRNITRLILALTLLVIIIILLYWNFTAQRKKQRMSSEMAREKLKNKLLQTELQALRSRMNPHFLFNSMNSIRSYIIQNNKKDASKYLSKFAALIRLIFSYSKQAEISLSEEIEAIKLYLELEKMRLEYKFDYCFDIADDVILEAVNIPPLLLQPVVENAIWHGVSHLSGNGQICIKIYKDKQQILIEIIDNGIGREKAAKFKKHSSHKSSGMNMILKTLQMYNQQNDLDYQMKVIDLYDKNTEASGTIVIFKLDFLE